MRRIACVVLLLAVAGSASAEDAMVKLYGEVLHEVRKKPDNPRALAALQPPSNTKDPAQRALFGDIVTTLEKAARQNPGNFGTAHNYYRALWEKYLYYGAVGDAKLALGQLEKTTSLAKIGSEERTRCVYERAVDILALKKEHAESIIGGDRIEAAIKQFTKAKRAAMNEGPYARRAILALAGLYMDKKDVQSAKQALRDALRLDTRRGYITNRAYDRLGRLRLDEGKLDGALAMLAASGRVEPDADLRARGFAWRLARRLLESGQGEKAMAYLQSAYDRSTQVKARVHPNLVYSLALGYTRTNKKGLAILYWKRYLDLPHSDQEQRRIARKTATELATN